MKTPLYDLHIHTNLSVCSSDPEQTVENIVKYAKENGIPTVAITNHVWDCELPAGSDFYAQQPFAHIMKIREQIPAETHGVRVLVGAESEFASKHVMLKKESRDQLDFLLIPHSHIHMYGLVLPKECTNFALKAKYLKESFCDLVSKDAATAIAHPFAPLGSDPYGVRAILSSITDDEFAACFALAKEHDTALEINGTEMLKVWDVPSALYEYERVFSIARDCGCIFTMGSDAHAVFALDNIHYSVKMAEKLGIGEDRFLKI